MFSCLCFAIIPDTYVVFDFKLISQSKIKNHKTTKNRRAEPCAVAICRRFADADRVIAVVFHLAVAEIAADLLQAIRWQLKSRTCELTIAFVSFVTIE